MRDRTDCRSADFAHTFGHGIGCGKYLVSLLIQEQMVVSKMRASDVPVESLRLKIKRKHIGQRRIECCRNVAHGLALLWPADLFWTVCPSGGLSHSDPRYLSF